MSAETKKVLEMLAAGKISAEDAERLLDKLSGAAQANESGTTDAQNAARTSTGAQTAAQGAKRPRYLRIQVERPGRHEVNLRVPLSLARGGRHWMASLPSSVVEKLSEHGIDFGSLGAVSDEEFQAALDRINVDIQKGNGKKVRIYAE